MIKKTTERMGIWFTKPKPQFEQRMPWVTSELIHDDGNLKEMTNSHYQLPPNEFAFEDVEELSLSVVRSTESTESSSGLQCSRVLP